MATVDEILASMPEVDITSATDEMLVINPDTRQIDLPSVELTFGVEDDAHAERKYFLSPRYVGNGLDLAACFLRVNFRNANGEIDAYLVDDAAVTADGKYVTFSWELSQKVTKYKGSVQFVVCAVGPDQRLEWHTTLATGLVLEGLEPDAVAVENATKDVIAQLLALVEAQTASVEAAGAEQVSKVKAEGATQIKAVQAASEAAETASVAEIEAKGVNTLASIPADYTSLGNAVDSLTRGRAGAIVCEAAGETVLIGDSSDLPMQGLRVFGKTTQATTTGAQLLDVPNSNTVDRGLTVVVSDGVCSVSGTASPLDGSTFECTLIGSYNRTDVLFVLQPGTYTLTDCSIISYDGVTRTKHYSGSTFTLTEEFGVTWVATRSYRMGEAVKEVTYPMINSGNVALPWEPYTGARPSPSPDYPQEMISLEPVVTVCGRNLIPVTDVAKKVDRGLTQIVSGGVCTVTGTVTSSSAFNLTICGSYYATDPMFILPPGTYTVKNCMIANAGSKKKYQDTTFTLTDPFPVTWVATRSYMVEEVVNETTYPRLYIGNESNPWEPYFTQTLELTHTLPGIPVASGGNYTDSDGQQWICDEVDLERGVYVQRVNRLAISPTNPKTFIGSDNFIYYPMGQYGMYGTVVYCSHYESLGVNSTGASMKFPGFATVEEFNTFVANNSVEVQYILDTPIETTLSESEIAAYRALHSNYPNTTVLNDSGAHMVVKYAADTKLYIDNKIKEALQ